ncbi:DUF1684 domain-containing protein [Streptomyces sp. NBC_01387]|uniref:DUF1684 domain-containing protein n=1 Tax=unclassified Streptomyces TaxID=2593676 RepID=UPI0020259DD8|nr:MULTISPECIES: DUF1684 domain-containing protein [unclassified Streptomyces]MCX4547836.1 DUF1684 domain-containing protein [Streptomyces sp. NBC_01500]WSC19518.1 DUF1684 domain-containing protein [Streptomyces sp. NBC_01766]WSV53539.1 DUF1684 domain-containing protein [Streptomyces sp. NBC_01014]
MSGPEVPAVPAVPAGSGEQAWEAWRAERHRSVTGPTGNLALVETRWLPAGERPDLDAVRAGQPETVTVTAVERTDMVSGEPEYGLRVWDAASPAVRHFEHIDVFPYDPEWVREAEYIPVPGARRVGFEHIRDNGGSRDLVVPGDIVLTVDGTPYTLSAFDDDGTLLLVLGDPTNGDSTYGAGRFLFVTHTGDGKVLLDFNRAFVPPCGFSDQYNCPMPPRQNRFHLPVEAGEKLPVFREGFPAH